MQTNSI